MTNMKYKNEIERLISVLINRSQESPDFAGIYGTIITELKYIIATVDKPDYYGEVMSQVEKDKTKPDKECGYNCEPCLSPKTCKQNKPTPSPLDELEEIEELKGSMDYPKECEDIAELINKLAFNQNSLIRNQRLIIKELKQK